jgi:membrane associated rhomboid family serine protease
MTSQQTEPDKCKHCGCPLPVNLKGPCPNCGKSGTTFGLTTQGVISPTGVTTTRLTTIREYYRTRPKVMVVGVLITIGISLVGFLFRGYNGAIIGFLLSLMYFLFGKPAKDKIREIDRRYKHD